MLRKIFIFFSIFTFSYILSHTAFSKVNILAPAFIEPLQFKGKAIVGVLNHQEKILAADYELTDIHDRPSFFAPVKIHDCVTAEEDPVGGGVLPLCQKDLANSCSSYFYALESGWTPKDAMDYKYTKPYLKACGGLELYGRLRESKNSHWNDRDTDTLGWSTWPVNIIADLLNENDSQFCGDASLSLGECEKNLDRSLQFSVNNRTITFRYEDIERVVTPALVGDYDGDGWEDLILWQETIDTKGSYRDFQYVCLLIPANGPSIAKTC